VIQRVPEPVTAKPRLHIDVHEPDIEAAAARAVELGATRLDATPVAEVGTGWIRLEDPEGNVFCIVQERRG
jgi:predicted enzyme related to lactoylglutathione lyase